MKRMLSIISAVSLASFALACSQAQFTGTPPARAKPKTEIPTPPPGGVSCAAAPASLKLGERATIGIRAEATDRELFQTVTSASGAKGELRLSRGESGVYVAAGGGENVVEALEAGIYKIEIRRLAGAAAADASCDLVAENGGVTLPPPPPPPPQCEPTQQLVGAHVAFMIDNSNSNAATDCPSPTKTGTFQGADLYVCGGETSREKAVLSAFDTLLAVAAKEPANANAISTLAISSFPTTADYVGGWARETQGMLDVLPASRDTVKSAMQFSRKPYGLTPYGAGLAGADAMFQGLADDGKAKVAILVTDGEPTDRDPLAVIDTAAALKARGIDVITVFYTGADARAVRQAKHVAMLRDVDAANRRAGKGPWYANSLASLEAYVKALLGDGSQKSLAQAISSGVVEVQDAKALEAAFQAIIRTKAIQCE